MYAVSLLRNVKHAQCWTSSRLCFWFDLYKKKFWKTLVILWGHWYPCFWLLMTSALGFKASVDLFTCMLPHLHATESLDSPLVRHLLPGCCGFQFNYVNFSKSSLYVKLTLEDSLKVTPSSQCTHRLDISSCRDIMEVTWRRIVKQHLYGNEAINNYDNDVTTNYAAAAAPERALHRHSTARLHELPITALDVVTWLLASREHPVTWFFAAHESGPRDAEHQSRTTAAARTEPGGKHWRIGGLLGTRLSFDPIPVIFM